MDKFTAGIRFNDEFAKYMSFEYDAETHICTVYLEGVVEGQTIRIKGEISNWEFIY